MSEGIVASIIGTHRFVHDVSGDTVNTASRLESHGIANRIQISEATAKRRAGRFAVEARGAIEVKGKLKTYFLNAAEAQPGKAESD